MRGRSLSLAKRTSPKVTILKQKQQIKVGGNAPDITTGGYFS